MKRLMIALSMLLLINMTAQAADKITTVPMQFAKGSYSSKVKGNFSGYDTLHYTVSAKAGQTMKVSIDGSDRANFALYIPGAIPGQKEAIFHGYEGKPWQGVLTRSGKYTIQVYQMAAFARRNSKVPHTLTVTVK